jgi:hypothetical protein
LVKQFVKAIFNPDGITKIPSGVDGIDLIIDTKRYGKKTKNRQLAPGNSKGSRHIITSKVEIFSAPTGWGDILSGPLVVADEEVVLAHPEHAHFRLPPGTYAVRFQADYSKEQIRRALD